MFVELSTYSFFQQTSAAHTLGLIRGTGNPTGSKTEQGRRVNRAHTQGVCGEWGAQGKETQGKQRERKPGIRTTCQFSAAA